MDYDKLSTKFGSSIPVNFTCVSTDIYEKRLTIHNLGGWVDVMVISSINIGSITTYLE